MKLMWENMFNKQSIWSGLSVKPCSGYHNTNSALHNILFESSKFRSMILSLKPHVRLINFTTQGALENECELFSLKLQCCSFNTILSYNINVIK
jgi:hypothetical protein